MVSNGRVVIVQFITIIVPMTTTGGGGRSGGCDHKFAKIVPKNMNLFRVGGHQSYREPERVLHVEQKQKLVPRPRLDICKYLLNFYSITPERLGWQSNLSSGGGAGNKLLQIF